MQKELLTSTCACYICALEKCQPLQLLCKVVQLPQSPNLHSLKTEQFFLIHLCQSHACSIATMPATINPSQPAHTLTNTHQAQQHTCGQHRLQRTPFGTLLRSRCRTEGN